MLGGRAASFTPIHPGQYRLVLRVEGILASVSQLIKWSGGGQDKMITEHVATYGTAGDKYLLAANHLWETVFGLQGRAGDDVLVAGPYRAVMYGGYA